MLKFCLITPSYKPDFARCRLLAESVARFAVSPIHHYIYVLQLHRHIETVTQQSWIRAIASSWYFSEYTLYGIFIERVLRENSEHYGDDLPICHDYWGKTPLGKKQLQQFMGEIPPESFAVMISAKSKTAVDSYASLVRNI